MLKGRVMVGFVAACVVALTAAGCATPGGSRRLRGGTAVWAELAGAPPNFIFPFTGASDDSVENGALFQALMYRPLYWFGVGGRPELNESLSLADPPVYSADDTAAVVELKPYRWSNGEAVTADDVMFWMNMLHADKAGWGFYAPGTIPDNVTRIVVDSPTRLTFYFNRAYDPLWMTYNQLSQITPMPKAWDVTAPRGRPGSGGCFGKPYGSADTACNRVYTFLSEQAGFSPSDPSAAAASLSSYATNPLWQVVDGPWHLTAFDPRGSLTMEPNAMYSGPVKPVLSKFEEVPFTSDTTEYNALKSGTIDVGYLPLDAAPPTNDPLASPTGTTFGGAYRQEPIYGWGVGYLTYNFNSTGDGGAAGRIFSQLYVRQAFQSLVDQSLYIQRVFKGWGIQDYGPLPVVPVNPFTSGAGQTNPYPYNVVHAQNLLRGHGWRVVPGGVSSCVDPGDGAGQCGSGIPAGARLDFDLLHGPDDPAVDLMISAEASSWAQAGIRVSLRQAPYAVVSRQQAPCRPGRGCGWELGVGGWLYSPDVYPTGEELFASGAAANAGNYSDARNDANIRATYQERVGLTAYANYLARQLPVIWQPLTVSEFTEVRSGLHGVTPQNPLLYLTPEAWYFGK
ncbi:MAG: ABC transporter substrate-binding protein [Acidimicrobiaceae bacterium]|nr:ABC transporter substrate-binding protein [Acidimicrobiaceae bacterium]